MKLKTILIIGSVTAVAGFSVWWFFFHKTKLQMINYLQANQYSDVDTATMETYGDDYITAWYEAASANPFQPTFTLAGKSYDTSGGGAM